MSETTTLVLECQQCGIKKWLYLGVDWSKDELSTAETNWSIFHSGHECFVGIKAALLHTFDPELEIVIKKEAELIKGENK